MSWVRYDDNVRNHPKVEALDDAPYRLWREAIEWCSQNLTDGVIRSRQLTLTSTRATRPRAVILVRQGLWHTAGAVCDSEWCPPSGPDGWVIHDYFEYQPSRKKVRERQAAAARRQARWLEAKKGTSKDASRDASPNAAPIPSHPAPKERGGVGVRCERCGNPVGSAYHRNVCNSKETT